MVIKVRKPFEPGTPQSKPTLPAITQVAEINPEFEEKPVVDSVSKTSEEYHGGNELSFSLPNTSVSSPIPMPTSSQSSGSSSSSVSEQQQFSSQQLTSLASETPKPSSQQSSEERPESSSPSSKTSATESPDQQSASEQQSITSSSSESSGQQQQQLESSNSFSEQQSSQTPETTKTSEQTSKSFASSASEQQLESSSEASTTETSVQESSASSEQPNEQAGAEEESEEDEDDEESEDNDDSEEGKNQAQSYVFNTQQAFDVANDADFSARYYQTEFYRFIEMIAEEKTKFFDPSGAEEYNVKKLMFRPFERKPLQHYRMARVRESVVLILDNSGSMTWWSRNIQILASLAMQRNDVEVYLAPNGYIEEMLHPKRVKVPHDDVVKKLRSRKIIYVGDFDGANTPIVLSWYNDVIWICPEKRYEHFREHDWVSYDEDRFKGAFLRVFTLEQMFEAFRKLLSSPSLKLWYDLFDEYFDEYVSQEGEDTS